MEEIIIKGREEKLMTNLTDGKTLHLPHYGVYLPPKPSILRVVFDCNAELNGRSINKELLPGPDLVKS